MFYTIYKVTNTKNGKIYIGKHQTSNPDDSYYGSGRSIRAAIKKYGKEHFIKEVLFIFDNEAEMNTKEKELINEEFVKRADTYNLGVGGEGGPHFKGIKHKKVTIERISRSNIGRTVSKKTRELLSNAGKGKTRSDEFKRKISQYRKSIEGRSVLKNANSTRKHHTPDTKSKISKSTTGITNSQYGTLWITNGLANRKINKNEDIPSGWKKGRVLKNRGEVS